MVETLITSTSNPVLWNQLSGIYNAVGKPGYVMLADRNVMYRVVQSVAGDIAFDLNTSELMDSRSFGKTKTSYKKLDSK